MDWGSLKRSVVQPSAPAPLPAAPAPKKAEPPLPVEPPPAAPVPVAAKPPENAPKLPPADDSPLDGARIWRELIPKIKSQRPLITAWVQAGRFLSADDGTLRIGFPPDQKMVVESLGKPNNRKFLETLLGELAGRPVSLKLEVRGENEEPPPPPAGEPPDFGDSTARDTLPTRPPAATAEAVSADPTEAFKNDPLIQKALKIFEGEIRPVA